MIGGIIFSFVNLVFMLDVRRVMGGNFGFLWDRRLLEKRRMNVDWLVVGGIVILFLFVCFGIIIGFWGFFFSMGFFGVDRVIICRRKFFFRVISFLVVEGGGVLLGVIYFIVIFDLILFSFGFLLFFFLLFVFLMWKVVSEWLLEVLFVFVCWIVILGFNFVLDMFGKINVCFIVFCVCFWFIVFFLVLIIFLEFIE